MRGFKDIIARRRPVTGATNEDTPGQDEAASEAILARTGEVVSDSVPDKHCDIHSARSARDHVPRPVRPQPHPRREWLPSDDIVPAPQAPVSARPTSKPKIWDIDPAPPGDPTPVDTGRTEPDLSDPALAASLLQASALARSAATLPPPGPRAASQRVKTRLIGFHTEAAAPDVFATPAAAAPVAAPAAPCFPIGWIVVTEGPGRGACFTLTAGLSTIGRDPDQTVSLDFGDSAISRERHIAIAYDDEENRTYVGHGGKTNIVRHNDMPLLTTEELSDGDTLKIGKTVLRYVAFCGTGFSWAQGPAAAGGQNTAGRDSGGRDSGVRDSGRQNTVRQDAGGQDA